MLDGLFGGRGATFFIQVSPREPWHIEGPDVDVMLCGVFVSVDATVRIRSGAAPSRALGCADCWMRWQKSRRDEE